MPYYRWFLVLLAAFGALLFVLHVGVAMPDDFLGIPQEEGGAVSLDYLGQQAPLAFEGQPALPVGGGAIGVSTGPATGADGTGAAAGISGGGEAGGGGGSTPGDGGAAILADIRQALGLGKSLNEVAGRVFGDGSAPPPGFPGSGQFATPGQGLLDEVSAGRAPQTDIFNPNFIGGAPDAAFGGLGGLEGGMTGYEASVADAASGAAGTGGSFVPLIGAALASVPNIVRHASNDNLPDNEKAIEAFHDVADAVAAAYTFGLSTFITPHLRKLYNQAFGIGDEIPHEVREAMDIAQGGARFKDVIPQFQSAGTPEELAQYVSASLDRNFAQDRGSVLINGIPSYDREGLQTLFSTTAPEAIDFKWTQGVGNPEKLNAPMTDLLRQQLAMIAQAKAGDPEALALLKQRQAGVQEATATKLRYLMEQAKSPEGWGWDQASGVGTG
jgi:hypothetical protein